MNEDRELLLALELRMRQLMLFCDSLKEENVLLKEEVEQKEKENSSLKATIKKLEMNYDDLKFAKSFTSGSLQEKEEAKRRLLKLVRDVDKCISILRG